MREILAALYRTILESVDSKKATTGLVGAITSSLVLLAGHQGWSWLTPEAANAIAGVVVVKGLAVIASHAAVDVAKAKATGPVSGDNATTVNVEAGRN